MKAMLVMRQLAAVMDEIFARVTQRYGLTPHDVLVLGWLAEERGISGSRVAYNIGRTRQSVQRALTRLEFRGFVERFESCVRDRAAGWALTANGQQLWNELGEAFTAQEKALEYRGVALHRFLDALDTLVRETRTVSWRFLRTGLIEVPQPGKIHEWDL